MGKFWFLLTVAFFDLMVAVVLVNWGYGSAAFLFLLMAVLLGGYAFFSTPTVQRDPRGRLQRAETPYGGVLGTAGAIAILACAAYVAFISSRPLPPEPPQPARTVATPQPAAPAAAYQPPRSYNPRSTSAALYKCVDGQGQSIFQSRPCAAGTTQVWVRDATPETPPSRAQLERQARARRAAEQQAAYEAAARSNGTQYSMPASGISVACQAARDADAAYRRRPLKEVTHDGLRRHGDRIREACG